MATNSTWTVIMDDKVVIKNNGAEAGTSYPINDDSFWSQSKFSNIWAIQYENSTASDQVEHRDTTPHCSYAEADLGDFQEFINRWDAAHLNQLQANWDADNENTINDDETYQPETEAEKIARLGPRPTSYSS